MKKFAFLLAIVALFAMSACAFADDSVFGAAVTSIEALGTQGAAINGAPNAENKVNAYYFGATAPTSTTVGVKMTSGTFTAGTTDKIGGFNGADGSETWLAGTATVSGTSFAGDVIFSSYNISEANNLVLRKLSIFDVKDTTKIGDSTSTINLTIVPTKIAFAPKTFTIELGEKPADFTLAFTNEDIALNTTAFNNVPTATNGDSTGITAAVDAAGKVKFEGAATKAGTFEFAVKASDQTTNTLTIDEGDVKGIKIADFPTVASTELTTITVKVLPKATNSADIEGASSIEIISSDVTDDILISTDIEQATDGEKKIAKSDDVLIYIDGVAMQTASKSYDIVARGDSTKYYNAIINADYLNTLTPGTHTVFVGNLDKTAPVRTDSVTIVVKRPETPVSPIEPIAKGSSDDVAISMIVASADVFGITDANSVDVTSITPEQIKVDPSSTDLKNKGIENARNNSGLIIDVPAAANEWIAIPKGTIKPVASENGNGVYFVKHFAKNSEYQFPHDFGTERKDTQGRLQSVTFNATLIVVNAAANEDVQKLNGYHPGATAGQGLYCSKTQDGQNVVVIYDGNATDSKIVDPIYARNASSHSSSSTCDLGFGLVAVAGLAALALRKRSK